MAKFKYYSTKQLVNFFIEQGKEGECWGFKQEWHDNIPDLVKDIICFANTTHDENCYLIFGVSDDLQVVGMKNPRIKQADIIDSLSNLNFAGDIIPKIEVETIDIDGVEVDVLIVFDVKNPPVYLKKPYGKMRDGCIYLRNGDKNTPDNGNADIEDIENLWRKRLGLTKPPLEIIFDRMHNKLEWTEQEDVFYNIYRPEYVIEIIDDEDKDLEIEFYAYAMTNSKSVNTKGLKMKKKLLSLTILTSLILSLFSVMPSTAAASELTADSFTYTVSDNQATVTKADAALTGEVSIPSELNGYTVVCIGEDAFRKNTSITDVTIPDTVTSIGASAFKDCTKITSVTIGSGLKTIPSGCFQGCSDLKEVTIGKNVTKIDSSAFRSCTSLSTIKWGSKLETIASSVFFNCRSLSVVEIPDTVISIDSYAFKNCSGIKELTIGKKVSYIGYESFRNCTGLKNIVISENVTTIDGYAFYSCSDVTEIYFPAGLQSVADNAFDNCSSITDVYYESSKDDWNHVSIGNGNTSLTNAVFHENYKEKDHTNPAATISSANAVAANQTVTLTLSDNAGVVSYYWGTSSSPDNSSFTSITSTTIRTETKTVSDSGTYYLIVKDAAGNSFSTKITFCKTTLNATNGTVTPSYVITKSGESFALPTAKKDGFRFLGWASDSNATSANYSEGTTYTPSSDTTLYAIWEADKKESLPGDVNGDGVVDAGDAVIISRYDTGLVTLTDTQIVIADVNDDGCADAGDAVIISRYDAGLISSLK